MYKKSRPRNPRRPRLIFCIDFLVCFEIIHPFAKQRFAFTSFLGTKSSHNSYESVLRNATFDNNKIIIFFRLRHKKMSNVSTNQNDFQSKWWIFLQMKCSGNRSKIQRDFNSVFKLVRLWIFRQIVLLKWQILEISYEEVFGNN